jgi:hypothetical protein
MEYWVSKTKKGINSYSKPIIPLFQQSIIPIFQQITLRDNGLLQELRGLQKHCLP